MLKTPLLVLGQPPFGDRDKIVASEESGERLQPVEEIERIGAAGAAIIDPSRIALNPDCGFAPDYGEPPSIDEAYQKLCHLSEAARRLRERFT